VAMGRERVWEKELLKLSSYVAQRKARR
jgi:hypothetical protein